MAPPDALFKTGEVVRIRDARWRIVSSVCHGGIVTIHAAGCDSGNRTERGRFLLPFEPCARVFASTKPRLVTPRQWRRTACRLVAGAPPAWSSLASAARADFAPLPFQLEPALALIRGLGCRYLIADAVGLGKTVQACLMVAELLERRSDARALVIVPAGLRDQWGQEFRTRFALDPEIVDATALARAAGNLPAHINPWSIHRLVIASIDYVKRPEVLRALEPLTWDVVVFDEAHNLSGRSDRTTAADLLAQRARTVVLLSATPHSGHDDAFARLTGLGSLRSDEPLVTFCRTRSDVSLTSRPRRRLLRVRLTPAETVMHAELMSYAARVWRQPAGEASAGARLAVLVLMRRACSSAFSLARSVERRLALLADVETEPTAVQRPLPFGTAATEDEEPVWALAAPGLDDPGEERRCLGRILDVAREAAAGESKTRMLRRLLARIREPAIVFTEYRDTLQQLEQAFGDEPALHLHGGLTARERTAVLRSFATGSPRLLLATDAGSEGLNLHHHCRLVLNLELPWTPMRLEQRAGRVDRIGQTRRVHIVSLVAGGTCEESTLARLIGRLGRASGAMARLSRPLTEQGVADAVFEAAPIAADATGPPLPPHLVKADLRPEAQQEAFRIAAARRLLSCGAGPDEGGRPAITHVRRGGRQPRQAEAIWLFTVTCAAAGRITWTTILPLRGTPPPGVRSAARARCLLEPSRELNELVRAASEDLLRQLRVAVAIPAAAWMEREARLMAHIRAHRARLSGGLRQFDLFGRRDERLAATLLAGVDEALSRCDIRRGELEALTEPVIDAVTLACAVLLD